MTSTVSSTIKQVLSCPYCGDAVQATEELTTCSACQTSYAFTPSGSLDMRLQKPKRVQLQFEVGGPLLPREGFAFETLTACPQPQVDYSAISTPVHLTKELLSYFPKAQSADSKMLDLGCGSTLHKGVCEHAGFEWVGMDYNSPRAPILGDAHALPFKDGSFEFIMSIAVLEHIRNPFVMMREAYRVLKPNGLFVGTVAFLEPFHGDSYYHHTHLGTWNSLQSAGFTIEKIAPSAEWTVLRAQAEMGLFSKLPKFIARAIVAPVQLLHVLWWNCARLISSKASKSVRIRNHTGVFTFIARKNPA
ncbi:MAG: class I SAM-dependent methyltransferase [Pseudomonadota bacterium]